MAEKCTLDDIAKKLGKFSNKELLLDVRTEDEFNEARISGSKNISHDEVAFRANELKGYDKIYIYCRMGGRARAATETLEAMGFTNLVCIDQHGMVYWQEKGYPTER